MVISSLDSTRTLPRNARAAIGLWAVAAGVAVCLTVGCTSNSKGESTAATSGSEAGGSSGAISATAGNAPSGGTGVSGGATVSQGGLGGNINSVAGAGASGKTVSGAGGGSGKAGGSAGAGTSGKAGSGGVTSTGGAGSSAPTLPAVTSVDTAGPFKTTQQLNSGPSSTSGLFYPTELGKDGLKHPIFVWGCGGTTTPSTYADMLGQIASHGFVVIGEVAEIGDNGAPLKTCIDWATDENERAQSMFYQKLNTAKIALGGHSIGSANAFYVATDPRLTTTIHVAGGSMDNINDPYAATTGQGGKNLVHPVAYICSENDMFGNVEKTEKDYANTTVPAFMTIMKGTEHIGAAQAGLPAITGWLRWHLGDETERRNMFLDPQGEFCTGIFVSKSKNW
jgi:predicted alpha/beta hydrolase family esterase